MFRKAEDKDIPAVAAIYEEVHSADERGEITACWQRGVYPTEETARNAMNAGELFVEEDNGEIVAAAIINRKQLESYKEGRWSTETDDVMVLHTLVVSPSRSHSGYGRAFVKFYEDFARKSGCCTLRMDTNERNAVARALYKTLGYREAGTIPATFNGIPGIRLVLLEKILS